MGSYRKDFAGWAKVAEEIEKRERRDVKTGQFIGRAWVRRLVRSWREKVSDLCDQF